MIKISGLLNLEAELKRFDKRPADLARAVSYSPTVISQLIRQNLWPKKNPHALQERIEGYLSELGSSLPANLFDFTNPEDSENEEDELTMNKEMISQEARQLYSIYRDPFTDDVRSHEDVFLNAENRYIRETLYNAAKNGGFVAVIGESGAGKSVLRRDLIDRINREEQSIKILTPSFPDRTRLSVASIVEAIIDDLNPDAPSRRSLEAKSRQMERMLKDSSRAGESHCLIIEEAHDLTLPILKNLKRFWELEDGFKRLLSIVLIGQPELKNKLDERRNWEAREVIRRIEIAELKPLQSDLKNYLIHKFKRIDVDITKVITDDAIDAIQARLTQPTRDGGLISMTYPLIVNNLTVKILNEAARIGANPIDADIVKLI